MNQYTPEEEKDIMERVEKANAMLKELKLQPAAYVSKVNLGKDVFADMVIGYLQDLKYPKEPVKSPYESNKKN